MKAKPSCCAIVIILAVMFPVLGLSQGQQLLIENAGFESAGTIAGWTAERAPGAGGGIYGIDSSVHHGGNQSLVLRHMNPGSSAIVSTPIQLQVGKLYRLSGWIRTENAVADPLSRYPSALPAVLAMASFPFTNTSMPVGGTRDWTKSEVVFIATQKADRVVLRLGCNGSAMGSAWLLNPTKLLRSIFLP